MINSFGWEDLYLKVFLDCESSWESQGDFSELASSGCVSEIVFYAIPPTSKHLASEALAFEHLYSEGVITSDPPASEETSDIWNSEEKKIN